MSTHDTAQCHEVSQSKGCGALETQSGPSEGPKTSPATSARDKSNFDVGASAASASSGASTASIGGPAGSPPPSATTKSMELAGATKSSGRLTDAWYMRGMGLCMCMCACVHVCMCACVHVCMCACVHVCMVHAHAHAHAHPHVCMCACCMCACVHVHVCMCGTAGKGGGAGECGRAGEERTCGAGRRLHLNALRAPVLRDVVLHLPGQRAQVRHLDRRHRVRLAAAREPRGAKVVALEEERQGRAPCASPLVGGEADLVGAEEGEGTAHLVAAAQQRRHGCFREQRRCDFDLGARRLQWHRGAAVKELIGAEAREVQRR